MITCNTDQLLASLQKAKQEIDIKLERMVKVFVDKIFYSAYSATPLGNASQYKALYEHRYQTLGLAPVEGFAQGSWQISLNGQIEMQNIYSGERARAIAGVDMNSYRLGNTITIGNTGPYIGRLEDNLSKQTNGRGIMEPATALMMTYSFSMKDYYDTGRA